jgi:MYXO-CTERM domain-containing protein
MIDDAGLVIPVDGGMVVPATADAATAVQTEARHKLYDRSCSLAPEETSPASTFVSLLLIGLLVHRRRTRR